MSTPTPDPTRDELIELLENNGFPGAAERIAAGEDIAKATAYIRGRKPRYDDAEGRWLHDYIDRLGVTK